MSAGAGLGAGCYYEGQEAPPVMPTADFNFSPQVVPQVDPEEFAFAFALALAASRGTLVQPRGSRRREGPFLRAVGAVADHYGPSQRPLAFAISLRLRALLCILDTLGEPWARFQEGNWILHPWIVLVAAVAPLARAGVFDAQDLVAIACKIGSLTAPPATGSAP